jgi:lipoyl(octanoyl) transferase
MLRARWLGRVPYHEADQLQRALHARAAADYLLLLEHPHVYTLGTTGDPAHVLVDPADVGAQLVRADRGGDVTYHGPGQVVGYPIIDLNPDRRDVHRYVRDLEAVLIGVAADYGIQAGRIEGLTGVWVHGEKLAAIGVRIARWITSHGFALNVTTDLDYFNLIVPCGIADRGVTSLVRLLGRPIDRAEVEIRIIEQFVKVFNFKDL